MLKALERIFAPPLNSPLYEERLRDNLRWTIAAIIGGLLLAIALNDGTETRIAFAVLVVALVGLMFMMRHGLTVARVATPLAVFLTLSWLVLTGSGLQDGAVAGFFVLIVAARAVGSGTSTVIYLLLTMAVFAAAYVMEHDGWTGEPVGAPSELDRLGNLYIVFVALTASIWFLAKNMEDDRDSAYEVLQEIEAHQEALAEKEEQYRLLADNSQDFIWTSDLDFNYTYCSPACKRIMGYTASELYGRSIFFRVEPQSDIDSFRQNLQDSMNLDAPEEGSENYRSRRSGSPVRTAKQGGRTYICLIFVTTGETSSVSSGRPGTLPTAFMHRCAPRRSRTSCGRPRKSTPLGNSRAALPMTSIICWSRSRAIVTSPPNTNRPRRRSSVMCPRSNARR
ncbi:MAG: PAS domain-containing protein [Gammaproteobacteria bacterium]|nr:PAS domain-containing protein [Gammaproteobacteria bacterium]